MPTPRPRIYDDPTFLEEPIDDDDGLIVRTLAEIEEEPIQWLWDPWLPLSKVVILAGEQGLGKSFATTDIAARLSRGWGWPNRPESRQDPCSTLFFSLEDGAADTIKPRARNAGADLGRIRIVEGVKRRDTGEGQFDITRDIDRLDKELRHHPEVRLLPIDPVTSYLGGATDSHVDASVRQALMPLVTLARTRRVTILLIAHLNKAVSLKAIYRVGGSIAFTAIARVGILLAQDPASAPGRLWLPFKYNIGKQPPALSFSPSNEGIQWNADESDTTADEALDPKKDRKPKPKRRDEAQELLHSVLARGSVAATDVVAKAEASGISARTLHTAKKDMGVRSMMQPLPDGSRAWFWYLADGPTASENGRSNGKHFAM